MHTGQEEFEALVKVLLPIAKKALEMEGEFPPFGGAFTQQGSVRRIESGVDATGSHPPLKVADWLLRTLSADARSGEFRATASIINVRVNTPRSDKPSDAIQIKLDHRDGISVEIFFPYRIKRPGQVTIGEAFSQPGSGVIFKSGAE